MTVTVCEAAFRSAIRQLNIEICYRPWSFAAFLLRDSLDAGSYLLLRGEPRFGASLATKTAGRIDRNLGAALVMWVGWRRFYSSRVNHVTSKSKKKLNGPQTLFVDSARPLIENLDAVAHAPNALWEPRSVLDLIN